MALKEKIRYLIEQRKIEATKKQIVQKMILISRVLGNQIVSTTTSSARMPQLWQLDSNNKMLDDEGDIVKLEEDDTWIDYEMGFCFDGLKCGINLCVLCLAYDSKVVQIKVTYNGYLVFLESEGEISAYAPFPAWEEAMEMFYEAAVVKEKTKLMEEKALREQERKTKLSEFFRAFKALWGY